MLNLDTHLVVHFLAGPCIGREYELISKQEITISNIVLWELAKLTALGWTWISRVTSSGAFSAR
jgi:hypothetical protein